MNNEQAEEPADPVDLLVKAVPRQLWVTIGCVVVMLASWLFFKPPLPEVAAATGETHEGRIVEEIVRTLVGSLGLILAVLVTSLLASLVAQRRDPAAPA